MPAGGSLPGERRGGRQKGTPNKLTVRHKKTLTELAQRYTKSALRTLNRIANDEEASETAQVSAAIALLDRGHGKPMQSHEIAGKGGGPIQYADLSKLSDEQIDALEAVVGTIADAGSDTSREDATRH